MGFGSLWVPVCDPGSVMRIDPETGKSRTIDLGGPTIQEEGSIAAGEGAVWVVTTAPSASSCGSTPSGTRSRPARPCQMGW